jgi:hypothetical protein
LSHGTSKFSGRQGGAAFEQPVKMRNIPETGIKCDFRNGCTPVGVIQQIPGADNDPLPVDMFSDGATRGGK